MSRAASDVVILSRHDITRPAGDRLCPATSGLCDDIIPKLLGSTT